MDFFANNVLFQRDLFLRYQFPDLPLYRGQCAALCRTLRSDGAVMFMQGDARVSHAPPDPRDFALRALWEGHDRARTAKLSGKVQELGLLELRRQLDRTRMRVEKRGERLAMSQQEIAAALALANTYVRLRLAGARWTDRFPDRAANLLGLRSGRHATFRWPDLAIPTTFESLPQPALRLARAAAEHHPNP